MSRSEMIQSQAGCRDLLQLASLEHLQESAGSHKILVKMKTWARKTLHHNFHPKDSELHPLHQQWSNSF